MTTVDILLLKILSESSSQTKIREIYSELNSLEISCCVANIYRRLHNLKSKKLVNTYWEAGNKFYSISTSGEIYLNTFKNQLQA
jgi:DNA-binding PadR family transcriptional regulator